MRRPATARPSGVTVRADLNRKPCALSELRPSLFDLGDQLVNGLPVFIGCSVVLKIVNTSDVIAKLATGSHNPTRRSTPLGARDRG